MVGWHYIGAAAASSQSAAPRETGFERGEAKPYGAVLGPNYSIDLLKLV